ncbi:MAG: VOC family protein [Thermoflavifilum sp.]|nr:VOC family protein [Thermoflavifilum sp.]MCL6514687.1 VOC family protein [Alicyclobacillus sp.]
MRLRLELFVADVARSAAFYQRVLGFDVVKSSPGYAVVRRDDVQIGLGAADQLSQDHPLRPLHAGERKGVGVEVVLEVEDVNAAYQRVAAAGYPVAEPLMVRPWGLTDFRVMDPDGYYLRITSR